MATIFRCDVCPFETSLDTDLYRVKVSKPDGVTGTMKFDICDTCKKKMFKSVKEFRGELVVKAEWK